MFYTDRLALYILRISHHRFLASLHLFTQNDYLQVIKIIFIGVLTSMGFLKIQTQLSKAL